MTCYWCKPIEHSYREKQFNPPGGYKPDGQNTFFQCECGQRWWCYNTFYALWSTVEDDFTWEAITRNIDDIPIAIGNPSCSLEGYGEQAIPMHKPCSNDVSDPRVSIKSINGKDTMMLQWIGDYEPLNMLRYQFEFPILHELEKWRNQIDSFRVPFVGELSRWPDPEQQASMIDHFDGKEDTFVAQLMSPKFEHQYDSGPGPISFVAGLVLLGDPNVGIIKPSYFFDPWIVEMVMSDFNHHINEQ